MRKFFRLTGPVTAWHAVRHQSREQHGREGTKGSIVLTNTKRLSSDLPLVHENYSKLVLTLWSDFSALAGDSSLPPSSSRPASNPMSLLSSEKVKNI